MLDDQSLLREYATNGSDDAFEKIVTRHLDFVFSSALRQVGDADLAKEVTQSVFIILAQKAASLRPETVLPGWLFRTTRYVALAQIRARGRRRQLEANFQMEPKITESQEQSAWEEIAPVLDEGLDTLAETDRQALLLRYFSRMSLAEVGSALALSEDAARKRISRGLEKLRTYLLKRKVVLPAATIAASLAANAVQAAPLGVKASVSAAVAKGAASTITLGFGPKLVSLLGNSALFSWLLPVLFAVSTLPSLLLLSLFGRMERKNFRDSEGFRPRLHKRFFASILWGYPILVFLVSLAGVCGAVLLGANHWQVVILCVMAFLLWASGRSLVICRNKFQMANFVYVLLLSLAVFGEATGILKPGVAKILMIMATGILVFFLKYRPIRMDYSLFLRASHGVLKAPSPSNPLETEVALSREELLQFARFLGERYLVSNFKHEPNALRLRMPAVSSSLLFNVAVVFMSPVSQGCSQLLLRSDGSAAARCGEKDAVDLTSLNPAVPTNPRELEQAVAHAVAQAWKDYRKGDVPAAERDLGQIPEGEIFGVAPSRAKSTRWLQVGFLLLVLLGLAAATLPRWAPPWLSNIRQPNVAEAEVRGLLNGRARFGTPLSYCLVLPSTNLFTPDALAAMRDKVCEPLGFKSVRTNGHTVREVFGAPFLRQAVAGRWISWADLGVDPESAKNELHTNWFHPSLSPVEDHFLTHGASWSWVKRQRFDVMRMGLDGLQTLRLLRDVNSLDLVDREKLIHLIASVQTLSGNPPGQPPIHDWQDVRGLFFTPCWPALQDTYYALSALEILGALDRIDREACIEGILKQHRGKGYFTSPFSSGGFNEYHIDGSAPDTFAAYESLRILGGLNRVKDLDQWRFRVRSCDLSHPDSNGVRNLTWEEVQAWVCQERLRRILLEHQANPAKRWGSLLDP